MVPVMCVTLADVKGILQRPSCMLFFKSMDHSFGVVKKEMWDDNA